MLDDYTLVGGMNDERRRLRDSAREFAATQVAPLSRQIDADDEIPQPLWDALVSPERRYLGSHIPAEYGGAGRDITDVAILMEEISSANFALATMIEITTVCPLFLQKFGSEAQKRRILPGIPTGEEFMGFMLTDHGAGSDAANLETVARRRGDKFVISGFKRLASMADFATVFVVIARAEDERGHDMGPSAFLVERSNPGMRIVEKKPVIGLRGHRVFSVAFEDAEVSVEDRLGEFGRGVDMAVSVLSDTRPTVGTGFVGLAKAALKIAIEHAGTWSSFGKPLYKHQGVSFPIAECVARVEAARLLSYRAAYLADQHLPHDREAAQAKFFASEACIDTIRMAMSVLGHDGASGDNELEMYLRDALSFDNAQGSAGIAKLVSARQLFS